MPHQFYYQGESFNIATHAISRELHHTLHLCTLTFVHFVDDYINS
jgi:hypothetical protein